MYEIPMSDIKKKFFRWGLTDCSYGLRAQYLLKLGHRFNAIEVNVLTDFCKT